MKYNQVPDESVITKTAAAMTARGFETTILETKDEVVDIITKLIPEGSEVMTMTSKTLDEVGVNKLINEGDKYVSIKNKLMSMDRTTQGREMQQLGAAPAYTVGSVHGITEDGVLLIASATGSQLPAYAYGSEKVIWVVGAQKISKNLDEATKRLNEYVLPLESERARIAYGVEGSNVSKVLILNNEFVPGRIKVLLVKEVLGF